jgi:hypothetical protein
MVFDFSFSSKNVLVKLPNVFADYDTPTIKLSEAFIYCRGTIS